jgi:2-haloacid dehalogenase
VIQPLPSRSPPTGTVRIEAALFDTFGTVCDFYQPMKRAFAALAVRHGVTCDAGALAIAWRTAYLHSTVAQAVQETPFRPLRAINRENLVAVLAGHFPVPVPEAEIDQLNTVWERLDAWPDSVPGLQAMRRHAIVAPLSNANFSDMVRLARHARLPWDIVLGASVAGFYKPHPRIYLDSVAALDLEPAQVLMVAAHQADLAYAAGHGMQTAFVRRPLEFGGPVLARVPESGTERLAAAEIHATAPWNYIADSFVELAQRLETAATRA